MLSRTQRFAALEVDEHSSRILFSAKLESQLAAHLLHLGLDLLHMLCRMIALANNDMKMRLPSSLVLSNTRLENSLRFFDELAVQIDAVPLNAAGCVVRAEDVFGRLAVVVVHSRGVGFALVGEFFRAGTVAIVVRLFRLPCR